MFRPTLESKSAVPITRESDRGFTLVEMVVSIAVFSILSLVMVGVYVAFSNNQVRAQAGQKVLNDGNYALEVMSREIRNDAVYYGVNPACPANYDNCLRLQKNDGSIVAFIGDDDSTTIFYGVWNTATSLWDMTELINFHEVLNMDFVVSPVTDPFVQGGPNQQPKVTIKLLIRPETERAIERVTFNLQTTVSSRVYKR